MELKQRDSYLMEALQTMDIHQKEELAKALKYNSLTELRNAYEYKEDLLALEEAIRYEGSDWMWHGVFGSDWATYTEILHSVAGHQKVEYNDNTTIKELEHRIIVSIIDTVWQKLDEEKKHEYEGAIRKLEEQMKTDNPKQLKKLLANFKVRDLSGISPATLLSAGIAFKMGGFFSYQILVVVVSALARTFGLKVAVTSLTRTASLAIPVLNIFFAVWLAWDVRGWICGPAMRKIVPAVFTVGVARMKQDADADVA